MRGYGRKGGVLILDFCPDTIDEKQPFSTWKGRKLLSLFMEGGLNAAYPTFYGWAAEYVPDLRVLWEHQSWRNVPSHHFERIRRPLWESIQQAKPKVIIAVGQEALRCLTDRHYSVDNTFSYVLDSEFTGIPVIPVKTIARFFEEGQGPEELFYVTAARKALRILNGEKSTRHSYVLADEQPTAASLTRLMDFMDICKNAPGVCVDIEKMPKDPHELTCIALTPTDAEGVATSGVSVPFVYKGSNFWLREETELLLWKKIAEVLASPGLKIFQNFIFDALFLSNLGFQINGEIMDTMLTEALLEPHPKRGLKDLARRYLLCEPWKDIKDWYVQKDAITFWRYNINDAINTAEIARHQMMLIKERGLELEYDVRIRQMIDPVLEACSLGMPFSVEVQAAGLKEQAALIQPLLQELKDLAGDHVPTKREYKLRRGAYAANAVYCVGSGEAKPTKAAAFYEYEPIVITRNDAGVLECRGESAKKLGGFSFPVFELLETDASFNPNSSKQVLAVLDSMGLDLPKVKGAGHKWSESSNTNALLRITMEQPNEITPRLLRYRALGKLTNAYYEMPVEQDGVMRFALDITGAYPRLSSRQTAWGTGGNSQNPPKSFRKCFQAPTGYVYIQADLSTAEARVVAQVAQDLALLRSIEGGTDLHVETASFIYGRDITKDPGYDKDESKLRAMGKLANFSLMYGLSPRSFCEHALKKGNIQLTLPEATEVVTKFFELRHRLKTWHKEVEETVYRTKTLVDPFGLPFRFRGTFDANMARKAYSYVPQSTVVNVTNRAWLKFASFGLPYARVANHIHDALLFVCKEDKLDACLQHIDEAFGSVFYEIRGVKYQIPWDIQVGPSWGNLRGYKK